MKNETMQAKEEEKVVSPEPESNISFSKQEIFGNLSLSLDSIRRRLMISGIINKIRQTFQIQLNTTRLISIKKVYSNIYIGQLRYRKLEEFLETIYLQFHRVCNRNSLVQYDSGQARRNHLLRSTARS